MRRRDPAAKAIVFSQFVSMLDLVEYRLARGGFRCLKLDGSMGFKARERVLARFGRDPACRTGVPNGRGPTRIIPNLKTLTLLRKSIHPFY